MIFGVISMFHAGLREGNNTNLDDFISGKLEAGNVHCITSHEIAVEDS